MSAVAAGSGPSAPTPPLRTLGRLVRAELLKVRTTLMLPAVAAVGVAFTALGVVAQLALRNVDQAAATLDTTEQVRALFGSASNASLICLVLGILVVTTEHRHGTITPTLLMEPRRELLVVAKTAGGAVLGAIVALACTLVTVGVAVPWLALIEHPPITAGEAAGAVLGAAAALVAWTVLGVAIGALVRNQIAAVVGGLVWVAFAEGLLVGLLPSVGKWLPSGATTAMSGGGGIEGLLPAWGGALVVLAYVLVLGALALRFTARRDIT